VAAAGRELSVRINARACVLGCVLFHGRDGNYPASLCRVLSGVGVGDHRPVDRLCHPCVRTRLCARIFQSPRIASKTCANVKLTPDSCNVRRLFCCSFANPARTKTSRRFAFFHAICLQKICFLSAVWCVSVCIRFILPGASLYEPCQRTSHMSKKKESSNLKEIYLKEKLQRKIEKEKHQRKRNVRERKTPEKEKHQRMRNARERETPEKDCTQEREGEREREIRSRQRRDCHSSGRLSNKIPKKKKEKP